MKTRKNFALVCSSKLAAVLSSVVLVACAVSEEADIGSPSESDDGGAPAAAQRACAKATEDWWKLMEDTATPISAESISDELYEVKIGAGKRRFNCRVSEDGDIQSIHGSGKRR